MLRVSSERVVEPLAHRGCLRSLQSVGTGTSRHAADVIHRTACTTPAWEIELLAFGTPREPMRMNHMTSGAGVYAKGGEG